MEFLHDINSDDEDDDQDDEKGEPEKGDSFGLAPDAAGVPALPHLKRSSRVSGVLGNSTFAALQVVDWQPFVVFARGPVEEMAILQPPGASVWAHLPWKALQGLKPWWLAVMSGGLFPLPPFPMQLSRSGCGQEQERKRFLTCCPVEKAWWLSSQAHPTRDQLGGNR